MSVVAPGIRIDIGSGAATQPGWYGIDNRAHPAVSLVWDLMSMPYPLDDACAVQIFAGGVATRIDPARWGFVAWMNELWRLLVPNGELFIVTPYGNNARFLADPAACNPCIEATWFYFDPAHKSGLWHVYQPQPWAIRSCAWDVTGNMETLLVKRS